MDLYLKKIMDDNVFLKDEDIYRINAGFTNLVYSIGDRFIVKVCKDKKNELNFKREIEFYRCNLESKYIPKLYSFYVSNSDDDFSYEILEKVRGKSLYFVWHEFGYEKRREIVREIVMMMRSFHSVRGRCYDWALYMKEKLKCDFKGCLDLFSLGEKNLFWHLLEKMDLYLECDDFRLVHADIHFDNIIYCKDGSLKIIDFETSLYAPLDYELDIFLRMCNNPLKYASEEAEGLVKIEDYEMIEKWFKEFYPEIYEFDNFEIRHEIYNLEANLRLLVRFPLDGELKDSVIKIMCLLKEMIQGEM